MNVNWKKWAIAVAGALLVTVGFRVFAEWRKEKAENLTIEEQVEELRRNGAIVENYYQGIK